MEKIKHIAIIMDGNGRWAKRQLLPRTFGHKKGVEKVREIAIYANDLGIECLTLYAFSTENWRRPAEEVNYLMSLPKIFFSSYMKEIMANNIKIQMIGSLEGVPAEARKIFESIRSEYGLGELQNTGLPDWTDGYDITDYLDQHPELGYDAILLDEGGDLINGQPVSRGLSIRLS